MLSEDSVKTIKAIGLVKDGESYAKYCLRCHLAGLQPVLENQFNALTELARREKIYKQFHEESQGVSLYVV